MCFQRQIRAYRRETDKIYKSFHSPNTQIMYTIEFYDTKRPFQRRQYRWRVRHINGNIIAQSSEGYNNRSDRDESFFRLRSALRDERFELKK